MPITICNDFVKITTNCPSGFYCFTDTVNHMCFKNMPMCSVTSVADGVLRVDCPEDLNCPYKAGNGTGYICTCPTRLEIYNQTKG